MKDSWNQGGLLVGHDQGRISVAYARHKTCACKIQMFVVVRGPHSPSPGGANPGCLHAVGIFLLILLISWVLQAIDMF